MIGTLFADRYRVDGKLGAGGRGVVWEAMDTHQDMKVALKTFAPGTPTIHAYSEAQVLTLLEGEHVLRVYNADTYTDIPYIATRIARLGSTEDALGNQAKGVRPDRVVSWIRQALVGLGACHGRSLLHRDIKPENIFLDSEDHALLGDFGLAYPLAENGHAPAEGTPLTMSPEMWDQGSGTFASDIYSMGVTMYRLLTGDWPIFANTRAEFRPLVLEGKYPALREVAPHVSRRLAARVHKAMAVTPEDRYQGWREMHEDLSRKGVVGRVWQRRLAHPRHRMCWSEIKPTQGTLHEVCVIPDGSGSLALETRRASGSRSRVRAFCLSGVREKHLGVALRHVFDHM